jgi:hypothetical protein
VGLSNLRVDPEGEIDVILENMLTCQYAKQVPMAWSRVGSAKHTRVM